MTAELFGHSARTPAGRAAAAVLAFLFSLGPAGAQFLWDDGDGAFWEVGNHLKSGTNAGWPARNLAVIGGGPEAGPGRLMVGTAAVITNDAGAVLYFADFLASQSNHVPAVNNWRGGWLFNDGGFAQQLEIIPGPVADAASTNLYFGVISVTDPITGSNVFVQLLDMRTNTAPASQSIMASNITAAAISRVPALGSRAILAITRPPASPALPRAGGSLTNFSSRAALANLGVIRRDGLPGATNARAVPSTGGVLRLAGSFTNNAAGGPDNVGMLLSSSDIQFTLIPEPSAAVLVGVGMGLLAGLRRRKRPLRRGNGSCWRS